MKIHENETIAKISQNINVMVLNRGQKCQNKLEPVVQSIVRLTSWLKGQLVKSLTNLYLNALIFFVEKMREVFAMQKFLIFF